MSPLYHQDQYLLDLVNWKKAQVGKKAPVIGSFFLLLFNHIYRSFEECVKRFTLKHAVL